MYATAMPERGTRRIRRGRVMAITVIRAMWVAALCAGAVQLPAVASPVGEGAAPATDYGLDANWLCRGARADACVQDQTTTVIAADGGMTREAFTPAADPPIDCFYVYPTVSFDPGGNSDLVPGPEEYFVVQAQFARFAAKCRTFAPMYRQATLTGLRARLSGNTSEPPDRALAYADVLAAWRHYLSHDNHGRGVVLIGHSQGALVLTQLISEEIDGKPIQAQLVSAILLGVNVVVPENADVGGTFRHVPACRAPTQTGCVISYVTFRDDAPPPPDGLFGRAVSALTLAPVGDSRALCTNPADLAGGPALLHSYFPTVAEQWTPHDYPWTTPPRPIDTPFVATPGLASARCVSDGPVTYLAIRVNAQEDDVRTHDIPGDLILGSRLRRDWGLHRIDMAVAMGDLVDLVGHQADAYLARQQ